MLISIILMNIYHPLFDKVFKLLYDMDKFMNRQLLQTIIKTISQNLLVILNIVSLVPVKVGSYRK